MNKAATMAFLSLMAMGAQAEPLPLQLTNLTLTVPFGTITLPIFEGSGSISGTDVNISSISWTSLTPNARYSY
ncbi:MAG: hypothetical protein JJT85_07265, partial [Chromatiales bacterium]|nr:hypothetical protein [Chromatiales bacterium]